MNLVIDPECCQDCTDRTAMIQVQLSAALADCPAVAQVCRPPVLPSACLRLDTSSLQNQAVYFGHFRPAGEFPGEACSVSPIVCSDCREGEGSKRAGDRYGAALRDRAVHAPQRLVPAPLLRLPFAAVRTVRLESASSNCRTRTRVRTQQSTTGERVQAVRF